MRTIFQEIASERFKQHEKWGEQNHPSFYERVAIPLDKRCESLAIPSEELIKSICNAKAKDGPLKNYILNNKEELKREIR